MRKSQFCNFSGKSLSSSDYTPKDSGKRLTQREPGSRSTSATAPRLWSQWRPCFPAGSGGEDGSESRTGDGRTPARTVTHVGQEVDHALRPVDAQQHDLVAEQDLQSHKHQDLTGAADHLVPDPADVWGKFSIDLQSQTEPHR